MVQAVVDLVGTPPFDFEWRRSRLIWDHKNNRHYKGEVLESHVVTGIQEHRYYINTSVEGIIEVSLFLSRLDWHIHVVTNLTI